jgi:uncharacterized membrane protein YfcA
MTTIVIGALIIGVVLGMLGSGGSAITVPVLIYGIGHGAKESIAESMAIVGIIAVIAAIPYARSRQIDWKSVWNFGIPGMLGALIGAWLGGMASESLQLIVFGSVLIISALVMLRIQNKGAVENDADVVTLRRSPIRTLALQGAIVGVVTGFVGVGGGFLIVPALVMLGKLPMRVAIGTSLVIIAVMSSVGFAKYEHYLLLHDMAVDWQAIAMFSAIGVIGSLMGRSINARLNQQTLKKIFATFLIIIGGFVIVYEGGKSVDSARWGTPSSDVITTPHTNTVEMVVSHQD